MSFIKMWFDDLVKPGDNDNRKEMKKYEHYSVHDFVKDEFFVEWVLHPHPDTDHFWTRWMEQHPKQQDTILRARMFIERANYRDEFEMSNSTYTRVFENLVRFQHQADRERVAMRRSAEMVWWAAAAIVLLALSVSLFFYQQPAEETVAREITTISKETPLGSKMLVRLPDGTRIKLNAGSKVTYPAVFDGEIREVYLSGEAFFEVARDESKPFVIHSNGLKTQVLGTSFNIRVSEEDTRVAVVSGLVKVTTETGQSSLIRPDNMAIYSQVQQSLEVRWFSRMEEMGWKDGILFFEKTPLKKVFATLEAWYAVEINVQKGISLEENYSGEYHNENLENVLSGIGYTSGFRYKIEDKKVEVFK